MIKKMDMETAKFIYENYLIEYFPQNEVKPFENIKRMWNIGLYEVYGYFIENRLIGFCFVVKAKDQGTYLLDYFAVLREERNKGYGGRILRELLQTLEISVDNSAAVILIETEDISLAANKPEHLERSRRDKFYERNGAIKTGICSKIYDANYRVWLLSAEKDKFKDDELDQICTTKYKKLYESMLSDKGYRNFFELYYSQV